MLCSWGSVEVWPEQVFSNRLYIVCIIHSYISFILFHCSSIPPPLYFSLIFIFWVKDISQLFLSDWLRVSLLSIFLMYYTYSCHHHRYFLSTIGLYFCSIIQLFLSDWLRILLIYNRSKFSPLVFLVYSLHAPASCLLFLVYILISFYRLSFLSCTALLFLHSLMHSIRKTTHYLNTLNFTWFVLKLVSTENYGTISN